MDKSLLLGVWKTLARLPSAIWRGEVGRNAARNRRRAGFMSAEHHKVRDYAVLELPRRGAPLPAEVIAVGTGLAPERTRAILDELEKKLTFVYRNAQGQVSWAYPVTVEATPHKIKLSSGEQLYAA